MLRLGLWFGQPCIQSENRARSNTAPGMCDPVDDAVAPLYHPARGKTIGSVHAVNLRIAAGLRDAKNPAIAVISLIDAVKVAIAGLDQRHRTTNVDAFLE